MFRDSITCGIIIPIYNPEPRLSEIASLKQLFKILSDYQIYFVCGVGFDCNYYIKLANTYSQGPFFIERFNDSYFSSIKGYNSLMLSLKFYWRFRKLDYILIHQLDAWIFRNELRAWCSKGFDYIGAPWYHLDRYDNLICDGIGNGGLSLRKVSAHIKVLLSFSFIRQFSYYYYLYNSNNTLIGFLTFLKRFFLCNNSFFLLNRFDQNEDGFWGIIIKSKFKWFKIPSIEIARKFSIEAFPSRIITGEKVLPFGCHAWEKHEPEFWTKYIKF
ncbi:DUF5672 family protein [Pedobacter psychrotolerans]|uniref:DUF5672 family protein n=1 Tax=Pedobacter psychrotolerans TaxID=1843235 RepID=UPI003F995074